MADSGRDKFTTPFAVPALRNKNGDDKNRTSDEIARKRSETESSQTQDYTIWQEVDTTTWRDLFPSPVPATPVGTPCADSPVLLSVGSELFSRVKSLAVDNAVRDEVNRSPLASRHLLPLADGQKAESLAQTRRRLARKIYAGNASTVHRLTGKHTARNVFGTAYPVYRNDGAFDDVAAAPLTATEKRAMRFQIKAGRGRLGPLSGVTSDKITTAKVALANLGVERGKAQNAEEFDDFFPAADDFGGEESEEDFVDDESGEAGEAGQDGDGEDEDDGGGGGVDSGDDDSESDSDNAEDDDEDDDDDDDDEQNENGSPESPDSAIWETASQYGNNSGDEGETDDGQESYDRSGYSDSDGQSTAAASDQYDGDIEDQSSHIYGDDDSEIAGYQSGASENGGSVQEFNSHEENFGTSRRRGRDEYEEDLVETLVVESEGSIHSSDLEQAGIPWGNDLEGPLRAHADWTEGVYMEDEDQEMIDVDDLAANEDANLAPALHPDNTSKARDAVDNIRHQAGGNKRRRLN